MSLENLEEVNKSEKTPISGPSPLAAEFLGITPSITPNEVKVAAVVDCAQLSTEVTKLGIRLDEWRKTYGPEHPIVMSTQELLKHYQKRMSGNCQ